MKKAAKYLLWVGILAALATPAFAETRTISWDPVTTYTDNTLIEAGKTVSYTAYWTTDMGLSLASLHILGASLTTTSTTFDPGVQGMTRGGTVYFTAKAVLNTGEESALSPAYAWVVPPVTPPPAVLTGIAVSGPSSVNESSTSTYTATGTWDNGTTMAITPTWSVSPTTYASISTGGVLTTLAVTANQTATVTASYTSGGVTKTATMNVTIVNVANVLTSIAVSGSSSVNESSTSTYTATGTWDNGTTMAITPTWSVSPTTYASISTGGVLTTLAVTSNQTATVTASYGGVTGTKTVTIVDVPGPPPAAPKNIGITGPLSSGSTEIWRVSWDPVNTYANDALIDPGRTVQYSVYWCNDPALPAGSLQLLASSIHATKVDFDPLAYPMVKNQVIYLTAQAILDTGDVSSLGASIDWVVANAGPAPPAGGIIKKKK